MIEGLTVKMCLAFGAGAIAGIGAGIWGTSLYYESSSRSTGTPGLPFNFANLVNHG